MRKWIAPVRPPQSMTKKYSTSLDIFLIPLTLALLILTGHYGIFFGHSFLMEQDHVYICASIAMPWESSWRLLQGFGTSHFTGDPGSDYGWTLFRYWNGLFGDKITACNGSILFFMWCISLTQYYFLKHIFPNTSRYIILPLALIIIFGSLRYEYLFLRIWLFIFIAIPLLSLTLHNFLKTQALHHFFPYTLLHFLCLFLGSSLTSQFAIEFSFIFFLAYVFFHNIHKDYKKLAALLGRFFIINLTTGIAIVLLGSWFFYSFFYEMWVFPHQRVSSLTTIPVWGDFQITTIIKSLLSYLQAGLVSTTSGILGYNQMIGLTTWNFASPFLPVLILVTLFYSTRSYWEYTAKFIVFFLLFFLLLIEYFPIIHKLFPAYVSTSTEFYPFIQVYEIVLLTFLIQRINQKTVQFSPMAIQTVRVVSVGLSILYMSLFILAFSVMFFPTQLENFLNITNQQALAGYISTEMMDLSSKLIQNNLILLKETWGWSTLLFFGSTGIMFIYFTKDSWPSILLLKKSRFFPIFLFVNVVLFSWSVFPMNPNLSVWDKKSFPEKSFPYMFKPFDRFASIGAPKCASVSNYNECVQHKFFNDLYGDRRLLVGYKDIPFPHANKSVHLMPENHAELIESFYEIEGITVDSPIKDFLGNPPRPKMRLFNLTATRYLLSEYPLEFFFELEHIKPLYSKKQFYLYHNTKALPYFYLANQIEIIDTYADLYNITDGIGFIWRKDISNFSRFMKSRNSGHVELIKFGQGRIEFQTRSAKPEFLIIADAWHPQGRVKIDGLEAKLYEANGIFKGVLITEGNHKIEFYFDDSPYKVGIWVSLATWFMFLGGWLVISQKRRPIQIALS